MTEHLKILMLEDSAADLEIIQRLLKKEKPLFEYYAASDKTQYILGLKEFQPDLILSDNTLPRFDATEALKILHEQSLSIPFILVTGTVSEEFAAGIIKLGADDYILKDRLTRLPSAIDNAIKQKKAEQEKEKTLECLKRSEKNLSAIFENTSEGFILIDREHQVKTFNEKAKKYVFLNTINELTAGENVFRFIHPSRENAVREMFVKVLDGHEIHYDRLFELDRAHPIWLQFSLTPVWEKNHIDGICVTARDITDRKKAEDNQRQMEREMLNQKVQEQKRISRVMIHAQEKERNHIGQELHDNVNQILAGIKIYLSRAGRDHAALETTLKYPLELVDTCMEEIRQLCKKYVTPVKGARLEDLARSLLDNLESNTKVKVEFTYDVSAPVDEELSLNLYRIIQEQINNIIKHAEAKHVVVAILGDDSCINITVSDDGKGFDMRQKRNGIGISNMINRVELFNGTITIDCAPGAGCIIKISISNTGVYQEPKK